MRRIALLLCLALVLGISGVVLADGISEDGLLLWYKADAIDLEDGASVTTWPDSSGNGHDATAVWGQVATYVADGLNGLPVVRFGESALATPDLSSAQPLTVFVLYKITEGEKGDQNVWDGKWDDSRYRLTASGGSWLEEGGRIITITDGGWNPGAQPRVHYTEEPYEAFQLAALIYDGEDSAIIIDGETYSGEMGTNQFTGLTLGSRVSKDRQYFFGDMAELIVYDRRLDDDEIADVKAYLSDKWGDLGQWGDLVPQGLPKADMAAVIADTDNWIAWGDGNIEFGEGTVTVKWGRATYLLADEAGLNDSLLSFNILVEDAFGEARFAFAVRHLNKDNTIWTGDRGGYLVWVHAGHDELQTWTPTQEFLISQEDGISHMSAVNEQVHIEFGAIPAGEGQTRLILRANGEEIYDDVVDNALDVEGTYFALYSNGQVVTISAAE